MGACHAESDKTSKQAWRKKPRQFAPKSRLGCKTCKIRRIKCDLSKPSCLKCQSTGRTCDGYSEMPTMCTTDLESAHPHYEVVRASNDVIRPPCTSTRPYQPNQWHVRAPSLGSYGLEPFMILPWTGPAHAEAMGFFEYICIKHLNEYHPCESWRRTLMFFSRTVPSVRHAALALALVHRRFLSRDDTDAGGQTQFSEGQQQDTAPLLHYNQAIRLLLSHETGDSTYQHAITLLVCYLFICFDNLTGNYVQAAKHLRGGVTLSRTTQDTLLDVDDRHLHLQPSGIHTFIQQATSQLRRLDMQAAAFLVDWAPADIGGARTLSSLSVNRAFPSLDEAADHLHVLVARVMMMRNQEQETRGASGISQSTIPSKDVVLGQLDTWLYLFENLLQRDNFYGPDSESYALVLLLRLHHTIAWTLLRSYGPGREMDYDDFLPQFQQCLAIASDLAAARERDPVSVKPTFTPDTGIIPVLYIIGVKCRHPVLRRRVLDILRRQPTREAVWDSIVAAKVVERVIEIEEGMSEGGGVAQDMKQIPVWRRVEDMSWSSVLHEQFVTQVDIRYTFCMREGLHIESLKV